MAKGWSFGGLTAALKDAAFKATGTLAGTVAAGDDSRIVNAVQPANAALCTAWVNFRGSNPVTIRSSYNVSEVVRLSTGKYQIFFDTPMLNEKYAVVLTIGDVIANGTAGGVVGLNGPVEAGTPRKKDIYGIEIWSRGGGGVYDNTEMNAVFFGGR